MACSIVTCRGAVFVSWGVPTLEDVDRCLAELRDAAEVNGGPVTYITRVPADAPTPSPEVQQRIRAVMPEFLKHCSTYHVVMEGAGFVSAVKRAVLTGLFTLGWRRKTLHVHATAQEVLQCVDLSVRTTAAMILQRAQMQGVLPGLGRPGAPQQESPPSRADVDAAKDRRSAILT